MFYDDIETRAPKNYDRIIDPFVSTVLFDSEHLSFRYSRDHHYHTAAAATTQATAAWPAF